MSTGTRRLARQGVDPARFNDPADVVRWLGAMQAQDYGQAVWGIGARLRAGTLAQVEAAIAAGHIVRTWPMRGTLHFVPAEDAKWLVGLSATRQLAATRRRREELGLDEAVLARCRALFDQHLHQRVTRPAVMDLLREAGVDPQGQRGYHILYHAAQTGQICVGPMEGKQQTFVLLDAWVPKSRELGREEALALLAQRYFASHGPATVQDFAWWAGLTLADARQGAAAVSEAGDEAQPTTRLHLLAGFDEFLLGYQDRSAVLAAAFADRIVPGGNGVFKSLVVEDGQVVGTWRRTVGKRAVTVEVERFDGHDPTCRAACERYAAFLGLPLAPLPG